MQICAGDYEDAAATADIVVIANGCGRKPGETRLDLLGRNSTVVREIVQRFKW